MAHVQSFTPIAGASARMLILGTMPGAASLNAHQYYAHPRNAFWPILADLIGFDPKIDYETRTQRLIDAGIAVWDVLMSCERHGSLDSQIEPTSIVANDFNGFFTGHPRIGRVYFNGATAEVLYKRHVLQTLMGTVHPSYVRLPSTSPANASIAASDKARVWRTCVLHSEAAIGVT